MTAREMAEQAELEVLAGSQGLDAEVTGGYYGDLISAVMANGDEGNVWITWHVHPNIVAAAVVVKLAAIALGHPQVQFVFEHRQDDTVVCRWDSKITNTTGNN